MTPTPFQRIEQLTRENTELRGEMARLHKLENTGAYFIKEIKEAVKRLQQAIFKLRKAQKEIDNDYIGVNKLR